MGPETIYLNNSSVSQGGGYLMGKIVWESAPDTASNTSSVTAALSVAKGGSTSSTWGTWSYSLSVGGQTVSGSVHLSILD